MSDLKTIKDHDEIKTRTEAHGGVLAKIKATGKDDNNGVLRIHFPK